MGNIPSKKFSRSTKSAKTTFKLTIDAINDLDYIASEMKLTKRKALDIILQSLIDGTEYFQEKTFYSTVIDAIGKKINDNSKRISFLMSEDFLPWLISIEQDTNKHRNDVLDSAIKTFRQFYELKHPDVQEEIQLLKLFMKSVDRMIKDVKEKMTLLKWRDALIYSKYPILEQWDKLCDDSEKFNAEFNNITFLD